MDKIWLLTSLLLILPPLVCWATPPTKHLFAEPDKREKTSNHSVSGYKLKPRNLKETIATGMKNGREVRRIESNNRLARFIYRQRRADYTTQLALNANDDGGKTSLLSQPLKNSGKLSYAFNDSGEGGDSKSNTLIWTHPIFRKNDLPLNEAELDWAIARLDRIQQLVNFRYKVIQHFYEVLRLQEKGLVNVDAVERWQKLLEFAKVRYELGTSTKIDVLNAEVNLGKAENDVLRDEQDLSTRRDNLSDLIGLPPTEHVVSSEALKFTTASLSVSDDWFREDIEIQKFKVGKARLKSRDGKRNAKPDLLFSSRYNNNDGEESDFINSLSWNLRLGKRPEEFTYYGLQQKESVSRIDLDQTLASVAIEQKEVVRNLVRLEQSIHIAKRSVKSAEESMEFSQFTFEKGLASAIELREAQANVTSAHSSCVNLLINYRLATFKYILAMGGDLD